MLELPVDVEIFARETFQIEKTCRVQTDIVENVNISPLERFSQVSTHIDNIIFYYY